MIIKSYLTMKKNHYDNLVKKLPRFALKNMTTLINIYIDNLIFLLKEQYILKSYIIYSKILYLFYMTYYNFILIT